MRLEPIACLVIFEFALYGVRAQRQPIDFESDQVSWPRLKRYAGYFTEGGSYRGGLYKRAKSTEHSHFHCTHNTTNYCQSWTVQERGSGVVEDGTCFCEEGETPYCGRWTCPRPAIEYTTPYHERGGGADTLRQDIVCTCNEVDSNEQYCIEWSCSESGVFGGNLEHDHFECLEADLFGQYCSRWKGNISSINEIESVVCECIDGAAAYCDYWQCRERGLVRCVASSGGWCDLNLALGVGGGFGLLFTLGGFLIARDASSNRGRLALFVFFCVFGCLPWMAGVVIWGGVRAIPVVSSIWIFAWVVASRCLCSRDNKPRDGATSKPKARAVHPISSSSLEP